MWLHSTAGQALCCNGHGTSLCQQAQSSACTGEGGSVAHDRRRQLGDRELQRDSTNIEEGAGKEGSAERAEPLLTACNTSNPQSCS